MTVTTKASALPGKPYSPARIAGEVHAVSAQIARAAEDIASTAVEAGAAYLDGLYAERWWDVDRIGLDKLDMRSPTYCVIGQLTGDYWSWRDTHSVHLALKWGFVCDPAGVAGRCMCTELTEAWRLLIEGRRLVNTEAEDAPR